MKENKNSIPHKTILNILHIADPMLPIGGFSHSNGLETYIQQNLVKDVATTHQFVESMLKNNYKYNDALVVKFAHEYGSQNNMQALIALDTQCHALKAPKEIREGSNKLGIRLLKIYSELIEHALLSDFQKQTKNKTCFGHYAVVYGLITQMENISIAEAVSSFYYNATVSMVTNAVKLVPLGQIDGQKILYNMHPVIAELTNETLGLDKDLIGVCNPALDIKCMQHERLYSRLYMS